MVAVAPTQFVVDFTFPVDAASVQADDLQVNGIAADTWYRSMIRIRPRLPLEPAQ